jgi:hypothetical protein
MAVLLTAMAGCTSKPDPSKERAMGLDGSLFVWEPGPPVAYVSGYEHEGSYSASGVLIIFPQNRRTARPIPGLEISFKPDVETGREIAFGGSERGVWVNYRLSSARPLPEGIMLGYESSFPDAEGRLTVEECDARPGGRIRGKLVYAKLRSAVYDQGIEDVVASRQASYLELWNWPFDLMLDQSPFE